MDKRFITLFFILIFASSAFAKRMTPKEVEPVIYRGIKFTAPIHTKKLGLVEGYDLATGKKVWEKKVYDVKINPLMEEDVQWIFIESLQITKDGKLLVIDESKRKFLIAVPKEILKERVSISEKLRMIEYTRHEFHGEPQECKASLVNFVYDIPYFSACGIFPPFHIINQIFDSGGGQGGMGSGAIWKPFKIEKEEYDGLVKAIKDSDIKEIEKKSRYARVPMKFDSSYDHIADRIQWVSEVCKKYRDTYLDERKNSENKGN